MRKTGRYARNAQKASRRLAEVHDLRVAALLCDLVAADGRVKAAQTLGVSYGALAWAADTGRLTGRMRDALARHLFEGGKVDEDEERDRLADLERRVAALEEGVRDSPEGEDAQVIKLRQELAKIGEDLERHGRRIAALETSGPMPKSVPVAEHPTPSRPAHELVLSLHPDPSDDEKRFGAAAALVVPSKIGGLVCVQMMRS